MLRGLIKSFLFFMFLTFLTGLFFSCQKVHLSKPTSLERIRERGSIIVITQNNGSTYYLYREQPAGFEYDLAAEFARYLEVDLEVVTPGWLEMFDMLDHGEGDFIAAGVTVVPSRKRRVDFSDPYLTVQQEVIVHHDNYDIESVDDLNGKTVHVRAGTSYQERLAELLGEGVDMELVLVPNVPTDELIRQVADSEIEITVADSNIALLNRMYHPDIRIAFPLSEPQSLAWAVRKGNGELLETMNGFFTRIRTDGTLNEIYSLYHDDGNSLNRFDLKAFHLRVETDLPRYRKMIREAADKHGFDWRLIAAMIYQESHFNPRARSHTGVRGLMQVTQRTAAEMGVVNRMDPEQSIDAGVGYLASLYERFDDIDNEEDRLLFSLASYNVGYGHVRDAQEIIRQHGRQDNSWSSLVEALPFLQMPEFYHETRYGYARGTEPVRYVENIMAYYEILKKKI
ncbi:MAG: membrane-bound lytic murein transglycosylase MltF [bacterium]|nr:membrane-bound lytic murein transglycosylase MltF [bacterium]